MHCHGQVGPYQKWLRGEITYDEALRMNKWSGIYRRGKVHGKRQWHLLPFYRPSNPQTLEQQYRRGLFRAGVILWQSLTNEEKAMYKKLGDAKQLNGFCFFMSEWMNSFKN